MLFLRVLAITTLSLSLNAQAQLSCRSLFDNLDIRFQGDLNIEKIIEELPVIDSGSIYTNVEGISFDLRENKEKLITKLLKVEKEGFVNIDFPLVIGSYKYDLDLQLKALNFKIQGPGVDYTINLRANQDHILTGRYENLDFLKLYLEKANEFNKNQKTDYRQLEKSVLSYETKTYFKALPKDFNEKLLSINKILNTNQAYELINDEYFPTRKVPKKLVNQINLNGQFIEIKDVGGETYWFKLTTQANEPIEVYIFKNRQDNKNLTLKGHIKYTNQGELFISADSDFYPSRLAYVLSGI